jgi:hypothetical protein
LVETSTERHFDYEVTRYSAHQPPDLGLFNAHEMPTIQVLYEITEHEVIVQKARFSDAATSAGRA